jgi:hypothetical protein
MPSDDHIEPTEEQQSVLTRSSNFQGDCSKGCYRGNNKEIHHILPCTTLNIRKADITDNRKDYIERCLWVTKWDINASDNLTGLPLKTRYQLSNGRNPVNKPCHNVDHGKYIDKCRQYLKARLWNKLNKKKEVHKVDVEKILKELKDGITFHEDLLDGFGERNGGTLISWQKRLDPGWLNKWYKPFSMALNATPRSPPGNTAKLPSLFKKFL